MESPAKEKVQGKDAQRHTCWNPGCMKEGTKRCSGCRTARYCSVACQQTHWLNSHRAECPALAEARKKRKEAEEKGEPIAASEENTAQSKEEKQEEEQKTSAKKKRSKKKKSKSRSATASPANALVPSSSSVSASSAPSANAPTKANCITIKAGAFSNAQELRALIQATPLRNLGSEYEEIREIRQRFGWASPSEAGQFYPRDQHMYYYFVYCDRAVQKDKKVPVNQAMQLALMDEIRGDVMLVYR